MDESDLAEGRDSPARDERLAAARPAERAPRGDALVLLWARQLRAIDAWNAARALRERTIRQAAGSRNQRLDAARRADALRRTQQALLDHVAAGQSEQCGPLLMPGPRAVIAHTNRWYAERISLELQADGTTVLAVSDNGADALGVVIAEQPDLLFVGDRLVMLTAPALLAEAALFAPRTVLIGQSDHGEELGLLDAGARAVLPRLLPAAEVSHRLHGFIAEGDDGEQP